MKSNDIQPRLLTKSQAAHYCGLAPATVGAVCPVTPIALGEGVRMHRYDVHEVDKWIDRFKAEKKDRSLADQLLMEKLSPPTTLEDRYIKVLKYMRDHPECDTALDIRGAGERTLDVLCEKKMISIVGKDDKGRLRYILNKPGKTELKAYEDWEQDRGR